jgi:hypothetical protein
VAGPLIRDTLQTKGLLALGAAAVLSWAGWVSITLIEAEEQALQNREILDERETRLLQLFSEITVIEQELSAIRDGQLQTRALIIDAMDQLTND